MNLVQFSLDRHQFTVVILLLLTTLGAASFFMMPRSEDPQFNFASAMVIAVYPGAAPADVEQLVVDPIEDAINELEDLKKVESVIRDGVGVVYVEFLQGTDPDEAYSDVQQAVTDSQRDLPAGIASLRVQKQSPTDVNVVQFALTSEDVATAILARQAEELERRLERVSAVKRADSWAFPEEQVHLSLDFERMNSSGVSFRQVASAVSSAGANIPGGDLDAGSRRYNVKTSGDFVSLDQIRRTVVQGTGTRAVFLEDVADVEFGTASDTHRARFNGTPAVLVTAVQREGSNIFDLVEGTRAVVDEFSTQLPEGVRIETVFDQSVSVRSRVGGFFSNLLQGMVLVGLVVLLALGFRASIIVMAAIPVSLFMALGWVDFSGFGLQQMSIVGLVIALGLLVDNAIVVTENVERFRGMGFDGKEAAVKGTVQVAWPIVSATVTTVLAFLPMVLLQTPTGDFIRSMPLTVIFALTASLIVSLTLTPLLASRFLSGRPNTRPARRPLARLLEGQVEGSYRRLLRGALRRPKTVMIAASLVFLGSLSLFPFVGVSLFPNAEKPQLLVNVDLPEGASLDQTDRVAREVERRLAGFPEVTDVAANVGQGNPRVYYNAFPKNETITHAQMLVQLGTVNVREISDLVAKIRRGMATIPGARIEVKEFLQGPPVKAPIAISVIGDNLDVLREEASKIEALLRRSPGTIDIDNPSSRFRTDLKVAINRDKAGLLGIPLDAVDQTVRAGLAGIPVSSFRDRDGEEYPVVLTLAEAARESAAGIDRPGVDRFERMLVPNRSGQAIPIRQIARLEFDSSPSLIEHRNQERVATVTASLMEGFNVAVTTRDVIERLAEVPLPPGYRYHIGGEEESRSESFGGMGQALLIALLGIFAVLVLQFSSFRQPMIVFAAIPFAITGAILALLIAGYTFSFTAFIGLTSLVGIVVNNSIILVDYANHLRAKGRSVIEAVQEAGETRFVPIILTTLTTIGGLLPLTLSGSTMWSPMGWAITGGLAVSTILTLVVVPVLYRLLTPGKVGV
jgi:multidrug efflux pump subunit AcrB